MSLFETITTLVSILALVTSVVAMIRTRKSQQKLLDFEEIHTELSKKQIARLEALEKERQEANLTVRFEGNGDPKRLVISNTGPASAKDIRFSLTEDNEHNPLVSGDFEQKLRYKLLHPGEQYHFLASFPMSVTQRVYYVNLRWNNESGSVTERDYNVSL